MTTYHISDPIFAILAEVDEAMALETYLLKVSRNKVRCVKQAKGIGGKVQS